MVWCCISRRKYSVKPVKVYVTQNNLAAIRCPECGKQKNIEVSKLKKNQKNIMVKCTCGFSFPIVFEKRQHYRKMVNFLGHYTEDNSSVTQNPIVIEDISRTGIRFRTPRQNQLSLRQKITVHFVLDDDQRTSLNVDVTVVRVKGQEAGGKFTSPDIPKALAFYLLP